MDDMPTIEVKVHSLGHNTACDENLRIEGRVESKHETLPRLSQGRAINQPDIGQESVWALPLQLVLAVGFRRLLAKVGTYLDTLESVDDVLPLSGATSLGKEKEEVTNNLAKGHHAEVGKG